LADICPEIKCDGKSAPTCPHIFMNDIALFPIDFKDAAFCKGVLRKNEEKAKSLDLSENLSSELLEIKLQKNS